MWKMKNAFIDWYISAGFTSEHLPQSSRELACTSFSDKFPLTFARKKVTTKVKSINESYLYSNFDFKVAFSYASIS